MITYTVYCSQDRAIAYTSFLLQCLACMSNFPTQSDTILLLLSCTFLHTPDYSDEGEELPLGPNFQDLVHYFML